MKNDETFSRKLVQAILDSLSDPVIVVSPDFQIRFMNNAARLQAGSGLNNGAGACCYQVLHNRISPCDEGEIGASCPAKEAIAAKGIVKHERKVFSGFYEVSATPLFDDDGNVIEVVEVFRNVTDGILLKEQLQKGEQQEREKLQLRDTLKLVERIKGEWEMTMDCLEEMVFLVNDHDKVVRCNFPFSEFLQRPFEDVIGKDWQELLRSNGLRNGKYIAEEKGEEFFVEQSKKFYLQRLYEVTDENGHLGRVGTLMDITRRKRAVLELESNRENLQIALDQLSKIIRQVIVDEKFGSYVDFNPEQLPCWGVMKCNKMGCPCYGKDFQPCWQVAGTQCKGEVQGCFAKKIGRCEQCRYYQGIMEDPISQIGLQFNNMMYILENKNLELEKAYADLKASQSQLLQQEKMASVGQLAAGVAHEINNPVGFVTSNLGSLRKYLEKISDFIAKCSEEIKASGSPDLLTAVQEQRRKLKVDLIMEDIDSLIKESLDGVERVKVIVQNLKNFSRVDQAEDVRADINTCLDDTLNIAWNELKYKVTVQKEYGDLPLTRCKPQQLNQVFMNILVNAAQSIEKKGIILIKTWVEDTAIFVSIEDTGCGISQENLSRIFEPFFTTKAIGKGTGLGLSITYDIIKKHGGDMQVTSEVGKGSKLTIRLPIKE
jgi:signal transduction histidine kinase/PAS domain-containing protein